MELQALSSSSSNAMEATNPDELMVQMQAADAARMEELGALQQRTAHLLEERERDRKRMKAVHNLQLVTPKPPPPPPRPRKRKPYEVVDPVTKANVIEHVLVNKEMRWWEGVKLYGVSRTWIGEQHKILVAQENGEQLEPHQPKKRGRHSQLNMDAIVFILESFEKQSDITYEEIAIELREKMGVDVSASTIGKTCEKMSITWKLELDIPERWNTVDVLYARQQYCALTMGKYLDKSKIIYIDEQGYNLHTRRKRGHAVSGELATISLAPKGPRISVIAAFSRDVGFFYYKFVVPISNKKRGSDAEDFGRFLYGLGPKIVGCVIVLDNCKIHHAQSIDEQWATLDRVYNVKHEYLPPYSPFLNAIEFAFNTLKAEVKASQFHNREDLRATIERAMQHATPQQAQGYYRHVESFYPDCILSLPFCGKPLEPIAQHPTPPEPAHTTTMTSVAISTAPLAILH